MTGADRLMIALTIAIAVAANVIIWGSVLRRARHPQPATPRHTPKHAATERIHAGGRYLATQPRRNSPPLTEQAIIRQREGRPWDTAAQPVLAQETPFLYDPAFDNCAGSPGCGDERVFFKWYGEQICCPRCYMNVFGGEPDAWLVHKITQQAPVNDDAETLRLGAWGRMPAERVIAAEGERLASVMRP